MRIVTLEPSATGSHHFRCDGRLVWVSRDCDTETAIASFLHRHPSSVIFREDYNPKQPRDARGRWKGGGGGRRGGSGGGKKGLAAKKVSELQDIAKKEGIDIDTLSHKSRKSVLTAAIKAKRRGQDLREKGLLKPTKTVAKKRSKKATNGTHEDIADYLEFPDKAISQLSKRLGINTKEAGFVADTLNDWSIDGYSRIKAAQKQGKALPESKAIDKYLQKMPAYKGEVSRGISFRSEADKQNFLESIQKKGVELRSHSSFSSDREMSKDFATNFKTDFDNPTGLLMVVKSNKTGVSVKPFSDFKEEDEVIVPKGTKYKVSGIKGQIKEHGKIIDVVELEEI